MNKKYVSFGISLLIGLTIFSTLVSASMVGYGDKGILGWFSNLFAIIGGEAHQYTPIYYGDRFLYPIEVFFEPFKTGTYQNWETGHVTIPSNYLPEGKTITRWDYMIMPITSGCPSDTYNNLFIQVTSGQITYQEFERQLGICGKVYPTGITNFEILNIDSNAFDLKTTYETQKQTPACMIDFSYTCGSTVYLIGYYGTSTTTTQTITTTTEIPTTTTTTLPPIVAPQQQDNTLILGVLGGFLFIIIATTVVIVRRRRRRR